MRFKLWLENMESAEDIFKRLSSLILAAPTYQAAIKSLSGAGIVPNFDTNRHAILGHKWSETFYNNIAGDKGNEKQNPELDRQIASLNSQIASLGFTPLDSTDPFYFFAIPGYKPDGAKNKIHIKIPTDKINLLLELAKIIKQNSNFVRQFKFSAFGGGFETRRDNFIVYLSKLGEENIDELRQKISRLGLSTDVGQDFKGGHGVSLSQTQLISLRLAAILVSKPGSPAPKFASSNHWQKTEQEFLMSDPVASPYIRGETQQPAGSAPQPVGSASQDYQPKTLVLSGGNRPLTINIDTQIGQPVLGSSLGPLAQYFSNIQFRIQKASNGWYLIPNTTAVNQTIINGSVVRGATRININDQIGIIGKSGRQIMPLRATNV
jgi:hypothetical protein